MVDCLQTLLPYTTLPAIQTFRGPSSTCGPSKAPPTTRPRAAESSSKRPRIQAAFCPVHSTKIVLLEHRLVVLQLEHLEPAPQHVLLLLQQCVHGKSFQQHNVCGQKRPKPHCSKSQHAAAGPPGFDIRSHVSYTGHSSHCVCFACSCHAFEVHECTMRSTSKENLVQVAKGPLLYIAACDTALTTSIQAAICKVHESVHSTTAI